MARKKQADIEKAVVVPRMRLGEIGYTGLRVVGGQIKEEIEPELQWPKAKYTYKKMAADTVISAALNLWTMWLARVPWKVAPPANPTEEEKAAAKLIEECMSDMDHSWFQFITEVSSYLQYGFAPTEKVFRRRLRSNGSRYDDGKIGWKKLSIRSQDTVKRWYWENDELAGFIQDYIPMTQGSDFLISSNVAGEEIAIQRKKFLLFRTKAKRDNPEGESILKGAYKSWKRRCELEEVEAVGIARDLSGIVVIRVPIQYMTEDASEANKRVRAYYEQAARNIHVNQQAGVVLPNAFDDKGNSMFDMELMGTKGAKQYDVNSVIQRYNAEILRTMFADVLMLGSNTSGNYNLAENKTGITSMAIEHCLKEIADVLNFDLIPQTLALNEIDVARYPEIVFENVSKPSLTDFSQALQRAGAVNLIEVDRDWYNLVREAFGLQPKPEDEAVDRNNLLRNETKSGAGMETGLPGGTGDAVSEVDASSANLSN